jgi:hypothetical protein
MLVMELCAGDSLANDRSPTAPCWHVHPLPVPSPPLPTLLQEEMFSFVTLADDQTTKKGVVVLEA